MSRMAVQYGAAYHCYLESLADGVAKEVAREVLPVGIYSTMYATANARSIMHFLSLRTEDEDATFVSHPQYEIAQVAQEIERLFAQSFPLIHSAWDKNGRVAP
jgi:thymidylate synthase (FAD)